MIRVGHYQISRETLALVSEQRARDECVLPIDDDGSTIRVAIGERGDYFAVLDGLAFTLSRRVEYDLVDPDPLAQQINDAYTLVATDVSNCPPVFSFKCPKRWLALLPTARDGVRHCEECRRDVHLCRDDRELLEHAQAGDCVALFQPTDGREALLGLVFPPGWTDADGTPEDER